jgi:hypothetical protein
MQIDIYLYPEASGRFDIILSVGLRSFGRRLGWFPPEEEVAPPVIAGSLFVSLVDQYGATMGLHVFQKMYAERKGPFQEGAKYDPEKPSVARKVAKAGGVVPDPKAQLMAFIGKKLRGR